MQLVRLISPVLVALVVSSAVIVIVAVILSRSMDTGAHMSERLLVSQQLKNIPGNLAKLAEDNTWWDEAVENIFIQENTSWLDATIGDTIVGFDSIDGTFVLRVDNSLLYEAALIDDVPEHRMFLANGLAASISRLIPVDADEAVSDAGFVAIEDQLFAVGVSMVQPAGRKTYDPPLGNSRRPVLVFYQKITAEVLDNLGSGLGLQQLRYAPAFAVGIDGLVMNDIAGQQAGVMLWSASKPGTEVLSQLAWPVAGFAVVLVLSLYVFVRRARGLIQELEQADRTKMAFLASMSHEVRTPLNAIIGFAEIVRLELHGEVKGEKNKEYLDIIRSSGEHLLTVINDILNISKLDAGKMEVFAEAMDPVEIIDQSMRMVENSANDRSIRLVKELESSMIISDERIIRQILVNLLSNAIKFTPAGGQVAVRSEIVDGGYKIIVADTGIGMSKEEIELALEPFGQVHKDKQNVGGTGLGLPLVNRFLELLGGSMSIRSAPAHGTSVTIELPEAAPMTREAAAANNQLI